MRAVWDKRAISLNSTLQTVGLHIMDPYVEWFIAKLLKKKLFHVSEYDTSSPLMRELSLFSVKGIKTSTILMLKMKAQFLFY